MIKENYLILNYSKLNFKKKKKLIFFDEFLFNLFPKKELKNNQCYFVNDFFYLEKKKINYLFLKKKVRIYRRQLSNKLNLIHNTNYPVEFWGLIIDYFLIILINAIYSNLDSILRIKKKYNFNVELISLKNIFFLDTSDFTRCLYADHNYSAYIRSVIINKIGNKKNYKIVNIKKNPSEEIIISYSLFYKFISNIIVLFVGIYLFIVRPTLILDGYFKIKNSLLIFLSSFGKIFFFNSSSFFYKRNIFIKKNKYLRESVNIKEKDQFDKIFNILLKDFFPSAYLESYKLYNENFFFLNRLTKIGSAVNLAADDRYKYLAAKILNKNGSLFTFQHGGFLGQSKSKLTELVEKKYSSKIFYWNNKKGLGMHYLSNFKKHQIDSGKKNNIILLYQTVLNINENYLDGDNLLIKHHPYLNSLYDFYNGLNSIYKNVSKVKLFPSYNISFIKKIWIKKCGNSINFAKKNKDLNLFYKSRIVVLDDISTALIELLYIGVPFILIHNKNFYDYDKNFLKYFNYLIGLKVLFYSNKEALEFINNNYPSINFWWKKVSEDKVFIEFKNKFFNIKKKNYISKIKKAII